MVSLRWFSSKSIDVFHSGWSLKLFSNPVLLSLKGESGECLSAGWYSDSVYQWLQSVSDRLLSWVRRLVVADLMSNSIKYFKAEARFQMVF